MTRSRGAVVFDNGKSIAATRLSRAFVAIGNDRLRLIALVAVVCLGSCQAKSVDLGKSARASNAERISALIDKLASKHDKPNSDSRKHVPYEPSIWTSVDELVGLGTDVFPTLVDHFDDDRFSYTEDCISCARSENPVLKQTVGFLCFQIVRPQVHRYGSWDGPDPRESPGYRTCIVPREKDLAVEWLRSSKGKALWQLQSENIQLVILENRAMLNEGLLPQDDQDLCAVAIEKNEELLEMFKINRSHILTRSIRPIYDR